MSQWYSSWIPRFPSLNFAFPTNLQRRFISFVLRKSLGHFLKPGQLDQRQIDSQIGAGYVQVSDLELNHEAINDLLSDYPLVLHDGFASSVTARIPWPNPLTSSLGVVMESLQLTFHVRPDWERNATSTNLAQSVASMAESFLHEELSAEDVPHPGASIDPVVLASQADASANVPGGLGLDSFQATEIEAASADLDPAGVSLFASFIERLLARFEFDARDTKVTIVQPGNMSLTVSIPEIRFRTEGDVRGAQTEDSVVSRKLSIFNFVIAVRQLQIPQDISSTRRTRTDPPSFPPSPLSGYPHSSTSSSTSSLDEEAQFHMSQSLAYLPPLSSVTSDMAASSMYHSAISTVPIPEEPSNHDNDPFNDNINEEDIIVSSDSTPLELSFTFQASTSYKGSTISSDPQAALGNTCNNETLHLHFAAGVLACALKAWHIRRISSLLETFSRRLGGKARSDVNSAPSTIISRTTAVEAEIRSIVVLLLFCPSTAESARQRTLLNSFYEKPLLSPSLGCDYLRLHFDSLSISALFGKKPQEPMLRSEPSSLHTNTTDLSFKMHDISAFFFTASSTPSTKTGSTTSSPILITDYHLPSQYQREHFHTPFPPNPGSEPCLPTFEVMDWTDTKHGDYGIKLNKWRYKGKRKREGANDNIFGSPRSHPRSPDRVAWSAEELSQSKRPPAVTLNFKTITRIAESSQRPELDVEIKFIPLHFFMDLAQLLKPHGLFQYLACAKIEQQFKERGFPSPALSTSGSLPEASPELQSASANEKLPDVTENKFEAGSDHDGGTYIPRGQYHNVTPMRANLRFKAHLKMIRVQVRCPPPVGRSLRSGALVLDVHAIIITNERSPATNVRFATHQTLPLGDAIVTGEFQRFLAAYAPSRLTEAVTFLSSGALLLRSHTRDDVTTDTVPSLLFPRIAVTSEDHSSLSLRLNLPSLCMDISKHTLDGLQYWADDVSQFTATEYTTDPELSTDSIIGSRFFNKSRASSAGLFSSGADTGSTGITVHAAVSEAYVRMLVPHIDAHLRPIICWASDLGLDVSTSSNEKNETALSVNMSDANISVPTQSDMHQTFFSLTAPRRLLSTTHPIVQVRFVSRTTASSSKESRVLISLNGFTCNLYSDFDWTMDLADFFKSPPGTFESVIPSERTCIGIRVTDGSARTFAPKHSGSVVCYLDDTEFSTNIVGNSTSSSFKAAVSTASVLAIDDVSQEETSTSRPLEGPAYWKNIGFALLAEISDLRLEYETIHNLDSPDLITAIIDHINLRGHLCADTLGPFTAFLADVGDAFKSESEEMRRSPSHTTKSKSRKDAVILPHSSSDTPPGLMASVEDLAFERLPEIGAAPDFVEDDLPTNIHYLDESFGAAAGLRELNDEDLEDFEGPELVLETSTTIVDASTARGGRETIKMLHPDGVHIVENFYGALAAQPSGAFDRNERTAFRMHVRNSEIALFLYDGYDWIRTRQTIEKEVQEMRRRLAKIKQLVRSGHTHDLDEFEETSALLFNSVHIGLRDTHEMDQSALVAAIDEELKDDVETATQSSWQTLRAPIPKQRLSLTRVHGKRLTRSKAPSIEFQLRGLEAEVYRYHSDEPIVSRILATVRDVEIFDHIKTSTWRKFLTSLRTDSRGNIRETGSNMVRIELLNVRPVPDHPSEESRLRAKILPLRLYVDQDAVDFLKKFFSFADHESTSNSGSSNNDETYFQFVEVFPIDLKLDYKPRHVDYRALREGRTIELMNFFHFDGAEMTLRHITLSGVTGWARLFELLNDLWTPDVKATQLVDVISGVAPIRSVVNVGSGLADLILLPIAQYKKDGRIVRGIQKGTTAFVKSTATEAVKMGARLATGTQVILEQAESVLGSQFKDPVMAETVPTITVDEFEDEEYMETSEENSDSSELISKYAQQPTDIKEGMRSAYKSLRKNFTSAAQTILAVPMEVYERSGNEGPIRSVIRAVPIAVLKPMIGASEAVSKTLLGLHNTLDPSIRHETEAKYKQ